MRLAGIPARVVVGYLGGEYNDLGHFFLVRQADTHAWCEVWLPEKGWTRVDPTAAVAPGRVSLDLTTFLETRIASGQMGGRSNALIARLLRSGVFTNVRFIWQTLSYEWDTRFLAFDADVQDVFLTSMGIASRGRFSRRRNSARRNCTARNLFRIDANADSFARGSCKGAV
jgi:Transglutaminase-like enzymes, putative cysteine proteases